MERSIAPVIMSGFALGLSLGNFLHIVADDSDARVRDVQVHNEQVREQLAGNYENIGRLILDDEGGTFRFNTGNGEVCKGQYEAETKTLKVVGKLSCTSSKEL